MSYVTTDSLIKLPAELVFVICFNLDYSNLYSLGMSCTYFWRWKWYVKSLPTWLLQRKSTTASSLLYFPNLEELDMMFLHPRVSLWDLLELPKLKRLKLFSKPYYFRPDSFNDELALTLITHLESLDLSKDGRMSDDYLKEMTGLKELNLVSNTTITTEAVRCLTGLQILHIGNNEMYIRCDSGQMARYLSFDKGSAISFDTLLNENFV